MSRSARIAPGGMVFHVINRGVGRMTIFEKEQDYAAFERILQETLECRAMRICSFCLMPNHWHFVLWPENDGDLGAFMQRLTITHVRCWQERCAHVGAREKSLPSQNKRTCPVFCPQSLLTPLKIQDF